jgi:transcriptional regulator with XRE-family HTH domain
MPGYTRSESAPVWCTDRLTYQQVHRYEHGLNKVSAGRLYDIARELRVPLESFFDGVEQNEGKLPHRQRRLLDTMRSIGEIESDKYRAVISQIIRSLSG